MKSQENSLILCACGCGNNLKLLDSQGRARRFISGHNTRLMKIPHCWCGKLAKYDEQGEIKCPIHSYSKKPYKTKRTVYRYLLDKKYRDLHKEQVHRHMQQYYTDHRVELIKSAIERNKRRKMKNPELFALKSRQSTTKGRDKLRKLLLDTLGGRCSHCGFSDYRALQVDHINGGGRKEIMSFSNQMYRYYKYIIDQIKNGNKEKYQVLCANCNLIKYHSERRRNDKVLSTNSASSTPA